MALPRAKPVAAGDRFTFQKTAFAQENAKNQFTGKMFSVIVEVLWPKQSAREMYAAATITLNRDEMERRRLEAAEDLLKGVTQARVARKFGVSRTTASRWCRALDAHGLERLRKRKAPGRPSRLTASQQAGIVDMFALGPRDFGFDTDRWTTDRLARAIETRFGVHYDPDHVGRLMHRLGLRRKPVTAIGETALVPAYASPAGCAMQL